MSKLFYSTIKLHKLNIERSDNIMIPLEAISKIGIFHPKAYFMKSNISMDPINI